MNAFHFIGRLTADPEITWTQSENSMCIAHFAIAVDRAFKKDGQPTADFPRCVAFGKRAELIEKYFSKGNRIGVSGEVRTGSYEKDGTKHFTTDFVVNDITFCESKKSADVNAEPNSYIPNSYATVPEDYSEITDEDAQLPF